MNIHPRTLQRAIALGTLLTASASAQVTYQHYRFEPTKLYAAGTVIQLSEFVLSNGGTPLNLIANNPEIVPPPALGQNGTAIDTVPVTVTGGSRPLLDAEGAPKIIDGALATKWLTPLGDNGGAAKFLYFSFTAPVTIDSYNFASGADTANFTNRNPIDWKIWGRNSAEEEWVLLDRVTNFPTNPASSTFQAQPFPISGDIPPVINYFEGNDTISLNGSTVSLEWDTFDPDLSVTAEAVSLSPAIDGLPPNPTDLREFTPPVNADTEYTLTATNGSRSTEKKLNLRSVAGGTATHRFYRFTPIAMRPGADAYQLSEFSFFHSGTEFNLYPTNAATPPATGSTGTNDNLVNVIVTNPGGSRPVDAPLLADGLPATRLTDIRIKPVIFEFEQDLTIDSYRFTTANDIEARDPVKWILEGSNDGTTWTLIDNVTAFAYPTPTARQVQSQIIPLPGTSLDSNVIVPPVQSWVGSVNTNYDGAFNWPAGIVPGSAQEVIVSDGTREAIRGGNLERNGKTTVTGTGKLTVNGRLLNRGEFNVSGGTLKQTGNYFIAGVNFPGTFNHTAGIVDATLDRGFFIADDAPAAGSKYLLSGTGQLIVKSTGNGNLSVGGGSLLHNVHIGKAAGGDLLEVAGGQASFTSSNNNFVYLSRSGILRVTGGSLGVANYTAMVVGFEGAGNNLLEISGGTVAITGQTPLLVGGGSTGTVTLSGGSLSVDQNISLGQSSANGTFTMTGGTLKAADITTGPLGTLATFNFDGGEITLTGDRRAITGQAWFHGAAGTTATYDAGLNRTTIKVIEPGDSPFATWAAAAGIPANLQGAGDDADGDGVVNLLEFALAGLPGNPGSRGIQAPVAAPGGVVITVAVRAGASFAVEGGRLTATIDGITYQIQGSTALGNWDAPVEEVTPALTTGVSNPESEDWELRSFRLGGTAPTAGFLRVEVEEAL
ncbi:hypothetical protein [Luteolibacter sp. Populi]|uniref:hypothetical protein n=1 Tax=Luteolibacter sp. Populi TaxID=3230487 RepID=UPI0034652F5F